MTNLEILIDFLSLEGKEKDAAILNNFDNQNSDTFYIEEDCYKVLSLSDIEDIVYDKEELFFEEMLDDLECSRFYPIAKVLTSEDYIKSVIRFLDVESYEFPDMSYMGSLYNKYIFNVE